MSWDRCQGGASLSNYTGGWHKDVSGVKKRIPQCPGVWVNTCLTYSLSPLVVSSWSVPGVWPPPDVSRPGEKLLGLLWALAAHCLCWDDLLHLLILVTCPNVPGASPWHATDRLLTPGLRGSLKIAGRVGIRAWLGFERNYKEIILRGFFLQWIIDSHGAGAGCPHYAHIITVLAPECSQDPCSDAARIPSLLTRPKKADMSRQNAGVTLTLHCSLVT